MSNGGSHAHIPTCTIAACRADHRLERSLELREDDVGEGHAVDLERATSPLQLDAFRAMEPPGYWDDWQRLDQPAVERMLGGLCSAMHAAMREYSNHGLQVVFDTALTNPTARRRLVDDLVDVPVYLVGVHCSLPELVRRESVRGDKRSGLAASQADWIHRHMLYDYEVDTTERKPDEAACDLAHWFFEGPAPSAFNRLKAPVNAA